MSTAVFALRISQSSRKTTHLLFWCPVSTPGSDFTSPTEFNLGGIVQSWYSSQDPNWTSVTENYVQGSWKYKEGLTILPGRSGKSPEVMLGLSHDSQRMVRETRSKPKTFEEHHAQKKRDIGKEKEEEQHSWRPARGHAGLELRLSVHVYFILVKSLKTIMMFRPDPTSLGLGTRHWSFIKVLQHSSIAARKPELQARKGKHLCLHSRLFTVSSQTSFSTYVSTSCPLTFLCHQYQTSCRSSRCLEIYTVPPWSFTQAHPSSGVAFLLVGDLESCHSSWPAQNPDFPGKPFPTALQMEEFLSPHFPRNLFLYWSDHLTCFITVSFITVFTPPSH